MPEYFDLEVSLVGVDPKIWRRFMIRSDASFMDLHEAIQIACGWWNYHLFVFRDDDGASLAGIPSGEVEEPDPDARDIPLSSFFHGVSDACLYEYDFGDSWEHEVVVREKVDLPERFTRRLLDGRRAFPPEDCGGLTGYRDCVEVAHGGEDPEGLGEWLGGWTPEAFDLAATRRPFDL